MNTQPAGLMSKGFAHLPCSWRRARRATLALFCGFVSGGLFSPGAKAQVAPSPAPTGPATRLDPQAKALFDQSMAAYKALNAYADNIKIESVSGYAFAPFQAEVRYQLPNHASVRLTNEVGTCRFVADGEWQWSQLPGMDKLCWRQRADAQSAIHDVLWQKRPLVKGSENGLGLWMLFQRGRLAWRWENPAIYELRLGKPEIVDGVMADTAVLDIRSPNETSLGYYTFGRKDHLVRRIVIRVPSSQGEKTLYTELHSKVQANPDFSPKTFSFQPPKGAEVVTVEKYPEIAVGDVPYPIIAKDLAAQSVSLEAYRGKVLLLDFWATWCGPCLKEIPGLQALYAQGHAQGLEVLGISLDSDAQQWKQFLNKHAWPWRQMQDADGQVAQHYNVARIPYTVLVGRDGRVRAVNLRGEELAQAVRAALAVEAPVLGNPVEPSAEKRKATAQPTDVAQPIDTLAAR